MYPVTKSHPSKTNPTTIAYFATRDAQIRYAAYLNVTTHGKSEFRYSAPDKFVPQPHPSPDPTVTLHVAIDGLDCSPLDTIRKVLEYISYDVADSDTEGYVDYLITREVDADGLTVNDTVYATLPD